MQKIKLYERLDGVECTQVDKYNQTAKTLPSLVLGMKATLEIVFFQGEGDTALTSSDLAYNAWSFVIGHDFNTATPVQIRVNSGITVNAAGVVSIPISNTATQELIAVLGSNENTTLICELVGFAAGETLPSFCAQWYIGVRNRVDLEGTTPTTAVAQYYTASQVNGLLSAGLEMQFSADGTSWHETQVAGDSYIRLRSTGVENAAWSEAFSVPTGADGEDGTNGTTPTVSIDATSKHWIINGVDSGIVAEGQDGTNGTNGTTPTVSIDSTNKHWVINGVDSGVLAEAQNNLTFADLTAEQRASLKGDTGATGPQGPAGTNGTNGTNGTDGVTPTVTIDATTKHWIINGTDTGVVAEGQDGEDGATGATGATGASGLTRSTVADTSSTSITLATMAAATDYHYGTLTALTINAVAAGDNESTAEFTSGSTACTLTLPSDVLTDYVDQPQANKLYKLAILNKLAVGRNFTPAGSTPAPTTGTLTVTITGASGQWSTDGGSTWRASGSSATLAAGSYTVTFSSVTGYVTPSSQSVTLAAGGTQTATGAYTETVPEYLWMGSGSYWTRMKKSTSTNAWYVDDDGPNCSVVKDMYTGVEYWSATYAGDPIGYSDSPASSHANPAKDSWSNLSNVSIVDTNPNGTLTVTLTGASGQWSIDGGSTWNNSGASVDAGPGSHTITFSAVSGYTTPSSQSVTLTAGQTTTATAEYVAEQSGGGSGSGIPDSYTGNLKVTYNAPYGNGQDTYTFVTKTGSATGTNRAWYNSSAGEGGDWLGYNTDTAMWEIFHSADGSENNWNEVIEYQQGTSVGTCASLGGAWSNGASIATDEECFAAGTLITLADHTQKAVEDITYDDELLVWDFDSGRFATARPAWIKREETSEVYYAATFSDGRRLEVVGPVTGAHRFFSTDTNRFEYVNRSAGHTTVTETGEELECVAVDVIRSEVKYYNLVTARHFNCFANGILTSNRFSNMYAIEDMKYIKEERTAGEWTKAFDAQTVADFRLDEMPDDMTEYVERMLENKA